MNKYQNNRWTSRLHAMIRPYYLSREYNRLEKRAATAAAIAKVAPTHLARMGALAGAKNGWDKCTAMGSEWNKVGKVF